jgi:hypothetical protein
VGGSELLHDFWSDGSEGEGLQAACGTNDIAGLQEGMYAGCKGAVRGRRRVTASSASAVRTRVGGRMLFRWGCIRRHFLSELVVEEGVGQPCDASTLVGSSERPLTMIRVQRRSWYESECHQLK